MYTIITENDESQWHDITGEQYHFPKRYLKFLPPNTKVIYYKGRAIKKAYAENRLTPHPHYFGIAEIDRIIKDDQSEKDDYYAVLKNFQAFDKPIVAKKPNGEYYEKIPPSMVRNYWRNGVRQSDKDTFNKLLSSISIRSSSQEINEKQQDSLQTELEEGGKKQIYTIVYERNRKLRNEAIKAHGVDCMACHFNFEKTYGRIGTGFIHVHHIKPISTVEKAKVNPETDLVVVCPNCHSMIHREKNNLLSIEDLKALMK
jgi:5-methylcytosine-specific restriction protein A